MSDVQQRPELSILTRLTGMAMRPLVWLFASLSGLLIAGVGGIPLMYVISLSETSSLQEIAILSALVPLSLLLGIAFARFLLRAVPLRADGERRPVVIGMFGIFGIAAVAGLAWSLIGSLAPLATPAVVDAEALRRLQAATIAWILGAIGPFLVRHAIPRHFFTRPFILFLRRFYTFSDRVLVGAVLKAAPSGKPVAFLTAPVSTAKDWNPFTVGLAGFKLWRPIRSAPVDLHSDEPWHDNAQTLIENAALIVLDATDGSDSIASEVAMIRDGGFTEKTLVVAPTLGSAGNDVLAQLGAQSSSIVEYRKSWLWALPSLILGAFGCLFAVFPIMFAVVMSTQAPGWVASDPLIWTPPAVITGTIGWLALFVTLFLRPALDHASKKTLRERLRGRAKDRKI